MIAALLIGREGSVGFPGKNVYNILGRPLMQYPLMAALNAKNVDEVYVSTDSKKIMEITESLGGKVIVRPPELCTKAALGEDAFVHGYKYITETLKKEVEFMVLMFCNAATILPEKIDEGIAALRNNKEFDSAVTVSGYNMWSPVRARRITSDGSLQPFITFEKYLFDGNGMTVNCDRDAQGDVYFHDCGVSVVRLHCLDNLKDGLLPQKWMGKKIYPLKQWGGLDVDYDWQMPQVEFWLEKNGFTEDELPYEIKKR